MVTYPIHVNRYRYCGTDPKKLRKAKEFNYIASVLEKHLNEKIKSQTQPTKIYYYYEIAEETGIPLSTVRDLCFSISGGSSGFTVNRPDLAKEETIKE